MLYCEHCDVHVDTPTDRCPLCGGKLRGSMEGVSEHFPRVHPAKPVARWIHKVWFFLIGLTLASILLHLWMGNYSTAYVVITVACIALGVGMLYSLKTHENLAFAILKQVLSLSLVLGVADWLTGMHRWSFNYVIPFLVIGGCFWGTLVLIINRRWFQDYFVYLISFCALGATTLLLQVFRLSTVWWPAFAATVYCGATIAGIFLFSGRRALFEVKKRLHI